MNDWPGKVIGACDYSARCGRVCPKRVGKEGQNSFDAIETIASTAWDEGLAYWWDLSNVVCFDHPIPCRGNVGMWQMPPDLAKRVTTIDSLSLYMDEKIATMDDAARIFRLAMPIAGVNEGFFVLPLDDSRRVLSEPVLVSLGEPTTTVIQPSEVFAVALKAGASAIIIAHNHPSDNLTPSIQDRELTASITSLGQQLGIRVLDHLILGTTSYASICTGHCVADDFADVSIVRAGTNCYHQAPEQCDK